MYARLVRFSLGAGKRSVIQAIADDLSVKIGAMPGCKGVTVFGDEGGECGLFVLWASEAEANAAAAVIRPQLEQHLAPHVQGPPDARLFEVITT
jgi:hypothetical protein